jgi:CheY-like chemotaxis protein
MGNLEGTETILIVDDEIFDLSLTRAMLTRYGYTVLIAGSSAEALHLFQKQPDITVDLSVVDVVMPKMDGFELAEHLQQIRPQLPIIYISAYPDRAELRSETARKFPFVPKSFTSLQLIRKIRELLDTPRVDGQTPLASGIVTRGRAPV